MDIESRIAKLNERMSGHYLPGDNETNVIAVCLFVSPAREGALPFVQGWFSRFDEHGYRRSRVDIEDFVAEGKHVSDVLSALEEYVDVTDELLNEEVINILRDVENIIEENGYGD